MLGSKFVCAFLDLNGEEAAGASFAHGPDDPAGSCLRGNGEHNVQTLVLTPEGKLLHAFAGYVDPDDLLEELTFAGTLARRVQEQKSPEQVVRQAHEERVTALSATLSPDGFEGFERMRRLSDHQFVARNPLLPAEEFTTKAMVGSATTFFGSSSGTTPKDRIGTPGARGLEGGERPAPTSRPTGRTRGRTDL